MFHMRFYSNCACIVEATANLQRPEAIFNYYAIDIPTDWAGWQSQRMDEANVSVRRGAGGLVATIESPTGFKAQVVLDGKAYPAFGYNDSLGLKPGELYSYGKVTRKRGKPEDVVIHPPAPSGFEPGAYVEILEGIDAGKECQIVKAGRTGAAFTVRLQDDTTTGYKQEELRPLFRRI